MTTLVPLELFEPNLVFDCPAYKREESTGHGGAKLATARFEFPRRLSGGHLNSFESAHWSH